MTTETAATAPSGTETASPSALDVLRQRAEFPALAKQIGGEPAVFFDGPAGSQVPRGVIDAITSYLIECNANHGGVFATSVESDARLEEAHRAVADLLGADDPHCVCFGQNMTSLTFALSRALARRWQPGDRILVTRTDHDANVTPWVLAAEDRGVEVERIEIDESDCTLDLADFRRKLNARTRLVAVGRASNATGTLHPIATIVRETHAVGGQVFVDAVHSVPHEPADVTAWDCDFLACSAYKFFGPHVGVLYGKRHLLEGLRPYKLRPAPDDLPGRWMTGTQSHESILGAAAAVEYLAELGRRCEPAAVDRRAALAAAYRAVAAHEAPHFRRLLTGLTSIPGVKIYGIADPARLSERTATVSFRHPCRTPREIAEYLAGRGIFVWHGNYYALPLTERLGLEPDGMVRIGLLHYNTAAEVERLLSALTDFLT